MIEFKHFVIGAFGLLFLTVILSTYSSLTKELVATTVENVVDVDFEPSSVWLFGGQASQCTVTTEENKYFLTHIASRTCQDFFNEGLLVVRYYSNGTKKYGGK